MLFIYCAQISTLKDDLIQFWEITGQTSLQPFQHEYNISRTPLHQLTTFKVYYKMILSLLEIYHQQFYFK